MNNNNPCPILISTENKIVNNQLKTFQFVSKMDNQFPTVMNHQTVDPQVVNHRVNANHQPINPEIKNMEVQIFTINFKTFLYIIGMMFFIRILISDEFKDKLSKENVFNDKITKMRDIRNLYNVNESVANSTEICNHEYSFD